jgi:hypothetical protein
LLIVLLNLFKSRKSIGRIMRAKQKTWLVILHPNRAVIRLLIPISPWQSRCAAGSPIGPTATGGLLMSSPALLTAVADEPGAKALRGKT